MALANELPQPVLVDVVAALGWHADASDQVKRVQQVAECHPLGSDGHGLEPGEEPDAHQLIIEELPIPLGCLLSGR